MNNEYDIIIAGSGLGGLVCANILSKEGLKVCVLEKNATIGGCLQSFKRKGALIDTGIHYVGSLDDGQILNHYFKYMGIMNQLKMKRLDEDGFDIITIKGKRYCHAMGYERFIETLSSEFPEERSNIQKIVNRIKEIGDLINVDVLRKERSFSIPSGLQYFGVSAAKFIEECTSNNHLQNVIAGSSVLGGGEKEYASLYVFGMIANSNIESCYRFVDGTQQVADRLAECIRENGGEIYPNAEITRFIVKNDRIAGVEINGNDLLHAKNYISDIHPARTLDLLDKCKAIKKAYISRINLLRESLGIFSVSIVFKENAFEYLNRNYYYYDENDVWITPDYARHGVKKILFCNSASSTDKYAKVAHILEPMSWQEVEKWTGTTVGQRGEEYEQFKRRRAEQLIDYIDRRHPGLKNAIADYYTATPLTYRDYTATKNGSAYGIIKDFNNPLVTLLPITTRIPNLFFTGQNNNIHGMIGVVLTAMYTCAEFVGRSYLAKKVGDV